MPETEGQSRGCPKCGCRHAEKVQRFSRWGQPTERRWCRYCGYSYLVPAKDSEVQTDIPGVPYYPIRCPVCGSDNTKIVSTRRPERRHVCQACGQPFKSIERAGV